MGIHLDIQKALLAQVKTAAASTGLSVAYPNVDFSPPKAGYIRVNIEALETTPAGLGESKLRENGLLLLDVFAPEGEALSGGMAHADTLAAAFVPGTALASGAASVKIVMPPRVSGGLSTPPFYMIPVTIQWRACET